MMKPSYPDLENKVVLITGATRGIGKAVSLSLAEQKAHIVFNYRLSSEDKAKTLIDELKEHGASNVHALPFDVTNHEQAKEQLSQFIKDVAPITGLVNNAGISKDQIVLRLKEEDVRQTLETNLLAPIMISQVLSRGFLKAENVSIVNMSSVVGLMGNPSQIAYSSSKAGLIGLTKSMAKELGSRNVRCNAICPGFIGTDMTEALEEKAKETYLSAIPLQRFGKVEEVANVVNFLLSQASGYITGECIKIDGGLYI